MDTSGIDLWRSIVASAKDDQDIKLKTLYQVVDQLPAAEKARLAKHLISSEDIADTFSNSPLGNFILTQIQAMNRHELGDLLNAIASRIKSEND